MLQRRGHHVGVMTNPLFKPQVGQAGLEFIPVGREEDLLNVGQNLQKQPPSHAWKLALNWTAASAAETVAYLNTRRLRYPTILVGSPLSFGMRLIAEQHSIPLATLILSPYVLRSAYSSGCMPPLLLQPWVPKLLKQWQFWAADRWVIDRILQPVLGPIRRKLGLPPTERFMHRWCFSPDLNLGCFPDWYAPLQPDWPPGMTHVGSVHWDPAVPHPDDAETIINWTTTCDQPPIAILAGSAGPPSAEFYQHWIEAAAQLHRGVVILEKDLALLPLPCPPHVRVAPYLSLDQLLPQVAVLIHSGSIGCTLRCAAAGVPQLIFPRANDQFDNAQRAQRLGIGTVLTPTRLAQLSCHSAKNLLREILSSDTVRQNCKRVAAWPQPSGAMAAAQLIDLAFRQRVSQT